MKLNLKITFLTTKKNNFIKGIFLLLFIFSFQINVAQDKANFIALDSNGKLYDVNPATCTYSSLNMCSNIVSSGAKPLSIAISGSVLYIVDNTGDLWKETYNGAGNCVKIGSFSSSSGYYGLTVNSTGILYAVTGKSLHSYNPTTNTFATLGNLPYSVGGDLLFYGGELYMADNALSLIKINLSNLSASTVAFNFPSGSNIFGFSSVSVPCSNNQAYAISSASTSKVLPLNMVNGVVGASCTLPFNIYDTASIAENGSYVPPAAPTLSITQPTCTTATATITVNQPVSGYVYSSDGVNYNNTVVFSGLPAGSSYSITAKDPTGCISVASSGKISILPTIPLAPTLTKTDSSCTSSTGSIQVSSPLGAGFTYSIDGTTFQTSPIFSSLSPKSYNVIVKNSSGCVSSATAETITATLTAVAPTLRKTDTSCTSSTGSIEVNAPLGAGFTYSIDGTTFQTSPIFSSLSPKSYNIIVKNSSGCVSSATAETITATPTAVAPTLKKTDTSCTSSTGGIEVTDPLGAGFTYSIDGTTFQTSPIFSSLSPKSYNIIVKNSSGCVSSATAETITTTPTAVAPTLKKTDTSCTSSTGSIEVTDPLGAGLTYSIDGTTFQTSPIFSSLSPKSYNVTVKNSSGCISLASSGTVGSVISSFDFAISGRCVNGSFALQSKPISNSYDGATATFQWKDQLGNSIGLNESTLDVSKALANTSVVEEFPLTYSLEITPVGGCPATKSYIISGVFCSIPKGISPDGNSKNDEFDLTGLGVIELHIFNRYGTEVYNFTNYTNQWHGQTNGGEELPDGTYFYSIHKVDGTSTTGWVYINRKQ